MQISISKNRVLSIFTLVMINVIAIDSLRNLPTNAGAGLMVPFYYLLASVLFLLPCIFITAELATHHPKTGGVYVWVREAFGPQWGFFTIWLQWIYNVFWYPTILSFIAANIAYLINPALANDKTFMISMIIGMFLIATVANSFSMRISGFVSTLSAIGGTIIPMIVIIVLGVCWWWSGKPLAIEPTWNHFIPSHITHPTNLAFLVVIFFSLMGLEMSAVHAEEVKNPQRNYPRALVYSSIIIVVSLVLASTAIAIVVPAHDLNIVSGLDQALAIFLQPFHLHWLMPVTILLIILGGFGGMAAWVIGPTKGLMVAAEDGCLPAKLAVHNRHNAPIAILIMQAIVVILLCGLFLFYPTISTSYWILSDLTAQLALMFYIVFFAAAIRLRYKTPRNEHAYRIPGGNVGIWVVGIIGILTCIGAILIGFIPPDTISVGTVFSFETILIVGIIVFGVLPFFMYRWLRGHEGN